MRLPLTAAALPAGPFLDRPRLLQRLAGRFQRRATVVQAGPGFGKTSLLVQAYNQNALLPRGLDLWLSCQRAHESAAALGSALRALVWAPGGLAAGLAETVRAVTDVIWSQTPTEVSLVLDDVHHVPEGSSGARLLAALLEALPANGHVVLASRTPPPVPLARLAAMGQVAWLEEEELRFSGAELAAFAELRSVPADGLEATCGWPALAELAARAGGTGGTQRSLVEDYLWQEVLRAIEPERRRRLAMLADLGDLDRELAAAAVGEEVDLDELMAGLPLVGRGGGRYRMHALLERELADGLDAASRTGCRERVAALLARRGQHSDAMRLAVSERHWPSMRVVLRDAAVRGRTVVPPDDLARWLRAVPDEQRAEPEALLLAACVTAARSPRLADEHFEAALRAHRCRGDLEGELGVLIQWGIHAWNLSQGASLGRMVDRTFELAELGLARAGPQAALGRAMAAYMAGSWPDVLAALEAVAPDIVPDELVGAGHYLRSLAYLGLGDVSNGALAATRAKELSGPGTRKLPLEAMASVHILAGDLPAAVAEMAEHGAEVRRGGQNGAIVAHHAVAAMLEARLGRLDASAEHLRRAAEHEVVMMASPIQMWLGFAQADHALETGDEERARSLLRAELRARPIGTPLSHALHQHKLVVLYVLLPESRRALEALDLRGLWTTALPVARALVALREQGDPRPAAGLELEPAQVRLHLPTPWAAELIVAGTAGAGDAARQVEELGAAYARWIKPLAGSTRPEVAVPARRVLARLPAEAPHEIEIRLLGSGELLRDGRVVDDADWTRRARVRELLAYLAAEGPVSREAVIADIWPELDGQAGRRNLRFTLTCLQRVLEPGRTPHQPPCFVRSEGDRLWLAPGDHLHVDVWSFEHRLDRAETADSPSAALEAYLAALPLWRGTYLAGQPGADWAAGRRDRLERRFVAAAVRAGELYLAREGTAPALELAGRALEVDPYCEPAFRLLAAAHRARGDLPAMRRALERCRLALGELGVKPAPETAMLERAGA